ncbi:MAG: hypothetical protein K9G46_02560 [Flavobacteriales bacterium]|nr:hypothetical protein [Flavobacteriales bacterium]
MDIKAIARKLAVLNHKLQTKGLDFVEKGIKEYEEKLVRQKPQAKLKAARNLGLE